MFHAHILPDSLTDEVAMDCEMVGVSPMGNKSALGRVTLVFSTMTLCTCHFSRMQSLNMVNFDIK